MEKPDYRIMKIEGMDFSITEGAKFVSICQNKMEYIGQVVKYNKYDVTGAIPVFVTSYDYTVQADDLDIVRKATR